MGLYYSTDFVLRWYKADDSLLEQDHGRTQYTVIDTDKLVALREQTPHLRLSEHGLKLTVFLQMGTALPMMELCRMNFYPAWKLV